MSEPGGTSASPMPAKLVRVSDRGTVSLGSLADFEFYMAAKRTDGTIVMEPMSLQPVRRGGTE